MLPYFHIFGYTLPAYGVMAALGLLAAIAYIFLARPRGSVTADVELSFVWGLVGCFVGAKLLYLLTAAPELAAALGEPGVGLFEALSPFLSGGFVFYGGLIGLLLWAYIYCRAAKADYWAVICRALPAVPLAHGFGRIGCFLTGCCYGRECSSLGIAFAHSEIAPNGVPLFPVQLVEAACVLGLSLVLASMARRGRPGREILAVYLISYGALRFILEFFRGDGYRGFLLGLSVSQLIAVCTVLFAAFLLSVCKRC